MKVIIVESYPGYFIVTLERIGCVGAVYDNRSRPFKFVYSDNWTKLTYDENTAVLAVVEPKVTLLNITRRLTK